jgi:hypothetical protein
VKKFSHDNHSLQCRRDQQNTAILLSILKRYLDIMYDNIKLNCKKIITY